MVVDARGGEGAQGQLQVFPDVVDELDALETVRVLARRVRVVPALGGAEGGLGGVLAGGGDVAGVRADFGGCCCCRRRGCGSGGGCCAVCGGRGAGGRSAGWRHGAGKDVRVVILRARLATAINGRERERSGRARLVVSRVRGGKALRERFAWGNRPRMRVGGLPVRGARFGRWQSVVFGRLEKQNEGQLGRSAGCDLDVARLLKFDKATRWVVLGHLAAPGGNYQTHQSTGRLVSGSAQVPT